MNTNQCIHARLRALAFAGVVCASAAAITPARAQSRPPAPPPPVPLSLAEQWRIETGQGSTRGITGLVGHVTAAPGGRVIAAPSMGGGDIFAVDSAGREVLWRLRAGRSPDLEVRFVARLGWTGTQLWIGDPGYDHVVLVDAQGRVMRSIENPAFARPRLRERGAYPVFGAIQPLARYADGSMLIRPLHQRQVADEVDADTLTSQFLRISESGVIESRIARFSPAAPASFDVGGRTVYRAVPFQHRTLWGVSPDGARIVLATPVAAGRDSGTVRVLILGERGDTVAATHVPVALTPVSTRSRDSALARVSGVPGLAIAQVRDGVRRLMPAMQTPVTRVIVARDHSIYIALTPAQRDSGAVRWLAIDSTGALFGRLVVPRGATLLAVEGARAWGVARDSTRVSALVQYRVVRGATRPAR